MSGCGVAAVMPTTVDDDSAACCDCCTRKRSAAARAIAICRARSAATSREISPWIDEYSCCSCASFDSIECFAAARAATTRACSAFASFNFAPARVTVVRNCFTCASTDASSAVTDFALSIRVIMSSRLRAPRMTSSVDSGWDVYSATRRCAIVRWLTRRLCFAIRSSRRFSRRLRWIFASWAVAASYCDRARSSESESCRNCPSTCCASARFEEIEGLANAGTAARRARQIPARTYGACPNLRMTTPLPGTGRAHR